MGTMVLTVRLVHVALGAFWVGAIVFLALFLEPSVRESGPEGGTVMGALNRRRFLPILLHVGGITVITGVYLLWNLSGGFSPAFMGSRAGILLSMGGLAGILALGIGHGISRPTMRRMSEVMGRVTASGEPPSPEDAALLERLRGKLRVAVRVAAVLLVIAVALMAVGPHV